MFFFNFRKQKHSSIPIRYIAQTGPVKEVNLKWRTGSSQQCVIDAGFTALQGDELSDPFIEVRVGSFALNVQANVSGTGSSREEGAAFQRKHNQVKVYGIYEQEQ